MPTLINMEYSEPELFIFFTEKLVELLGYEGGPIDAGLYALDNGFVYYYNGVYAISDSENQVREVVISDKNKLGMILIDTKAASKKNKQLIRKLEEFLTLLNKRMVELSDGSLVNIQLLSDYTVDDIKEEIMIQHAV